MDRTVFLIGFVIMSFSSPLIYARGAKEPEIRHHTYFHAVVPFIAATAYLAMALGVGEVVSADALTTFTPRYADWAVTTPILLAGLILLGLHEHGRASGFLVAALVLDALMIGAGLLSSLSTDDGAKLAWYLWSCAAFGGVLYILWVPILTISRAEGGPMTNAYIKNLGFLTIVWLLYPLVFAVAPEGIGMITTVASTWAILVLDVVAKVVYAFFAARNIDQAYKVQSRTAPR